MSPILYKRITSRDEGDGKLEIYVLSSSRRDMLADIRSGTNHLRLAHVIVLQENDLEQIANIIVLVDHRADRIDQMNNLLGHPVPWRGFTTKDAHTRHLRLSLLRRHSLERQVTMNHTKDVELLALILVDTLNLHVKQGRWVDNHARSVLDVLRQAHLVGVLDLCPLLAELLIVDMLLQLTQERQVLEELIPAALGGDELGESRVSLVQPATGCDSVCYVCEFVGPVDCNKVLEDGGLDEVGVKLCHAVDLVGADDGEERHAHHLGLGFFNDGYAAEDVSVVGEGLLHGLQEIQVDVVDDLEVAREQVLDEADGPFLKSFREDRMIGISKLLILLVSLSFRRWCRV